MSDLRFELERTLGTESVETIGIDGAPVPLALPRDEEQVGEIVRMAARDGLRIVPLGFGSKLGWCAPARDASFALSTRRITGVVACEPGEGTLTARAGTRWSELRAHAAELGHWLSPDIAHPERATLGGVVAAGQSGLDRQRFGPVRNQLLGARALLGDGTIAKTGGRLVKNVTGYDLQRLYCGSFGTLCILVEASLRLHSLARRDITCTTTVRSIETLFELSHAALALPIRIVSLVAMRNDPRGEDGRWTVFVRLFGASDTVDAELTTLRDAWSSASLSIEEDADPNERFVENETRTWLYATCRPSVLPRALEVAERVLERASFRPTWVLQPSIAILDVFLRRAASDSSAAGEIAALTTRLRAALAPLNARVALRNAPSASYRIVDPLGEPSVAIGMMHRLQDALDPRAVFARGRFHAGL